MLVRVHFEEDTNFRKEDLTWVPTLQEVENIREALEALVEYNNKRKRSKEAD